MIDNIVKDIVNAGIGAVESIRKTVNDNSKNLQNIFEDLKAKGASDQSESAVRVREAIDKAMANVDDLRHKVDNFVQDQQVKLTESVDKIKVQLPNLKIDDLKLKINELSQDIQSRFSQSPKA